jgi:LysR family glycine cleavage system transcriptional activator
MPNDCQIMSTWYIDSMGWQLPSLAALRTFEAAARHLSFTKAGAELNLTQSAVSRHIRGIEEYLGVLMFERVRQRLILTDAGRAYSRDIRTGLEQMQSATVNLVAHQGRGGILRLATPPAFCVKWLIPRLDRFSNAHPNILIDLVTRNTTFNFETEPLLDAAIHYGNNDWVGVMVDRLVGEEMVTVCSQDYLDRHPPLHSASDLRNHVLLQPTRRPNTWHDWLEANNVSGMNAWAGPRFEHFYMIIQAAIAGLGVALLPRLLVNDDLISQRLIIPFDGSFVSRDAYGLVYPASKRNDPRLEQFRKWLLDEAAMAQTSAIRHQKRKAARRTAIVRVVVR